MILNNIKDQSLERNSNFELLRIIAMFEIVIWHIIIHGKVIDTANPALSFILRIILFICITHVNSFAMISGYFQYDKKFKPKKIILLILTLFFYNFIINLIFFKMGITSIGLFDLFMRMSPLASNNYWFLTSYIILYLISPFINRLINSLNKKEHLFLIFTLSFIYFLLPILSIGYFNTPNGYTPIQLLIFYIIGSYVNKYKIFDSFKTKKEKKIRQINLLLGILSCVTLNVFLFFLSARFIELNIPIISLISTYIYHNVLSSYASPIVVIQTILVFFLFKSMKIKSKFINITSATTFGIYIIHENSFMRSNLYGWLGFNNNMNESIIQILFLIFGYGILIFLVCAFIEKLRKILLEDRKFYQFGVNKLNKLLLNKITVENE